MKHYVIMHQRTAARARVVGVYHEPGWPIYLARGYASSACTNPGCYTEKVSAGQEIFRATYGIEGECYLVDKVPAQVHVLEPGDPVPAPRSPEKAKAWLLEQLKQLVDGEWELVDSMMERETIVREEEGSPFLGKFPGPNLFYSLHFRLAEAARALLNVSNDDRARVRETLKED